MASIDTGKKHLIKFNTIDDKKNSQLTKNKREHLQTGNKYPQKFCSKYI